MRTSLQPEIATTSVRTGFAMTNMVAFPCHCHEALCRAVSFIVVRFSRADCEARSDAAAQPFARNDRYGCGVPLAGIAGACPTIFLQVELLQAIRVNHLIPARGRKLEIPNQLTLSWRTNSSPRGDYKRKEGMHPA